MKIQKTRNIIRIALAVALPLLVLLMMAPIGFANPLEDAGKGGAAGDKPGAAYQLFGDKTNSTGSANTVFHTTAGGGFGGWQFYADAATGIVLSGICGGDDPCTGVYGVGGATGVYGQSGTFGGDVFPNVNSGVFGITNAAGKYAIGVYGVGYRASGEQIGVEGRTSSKNAIGVAGISQGTGVYADNAAPGSDPEPNLGNHYGLYAHSGTPNGFAVYAISDDDKAGGGIYASTSHGNGIFGAAKSSATDPQQTGGVVGYMTNYPGDDPAKHSGVYGNCPVCIGVTGESAIYIGVRGLTGGDSASYGGYFSATQGIGLYGESNSKYGVYGKSSSSYAVLGISTTGYGVYGKGTNGIGVYAKTDNGNIALRAVQPNAGAGNYAGYFDGNVRVNGNLTCSGSCVAALGVATDQGEKLVYADASTQSYLSDQGSATLKNGRAIIKIDPLFAQTVSLGTDYQVLVTPDSLDTYGLGVINRSATSFEVGELKGGKGNFSFSWRLTAPRKGYENVRLASGPAKIPAPAADVK